MQENTVFTQLPGWTDDRQAEAVAALEQSCDAFDRMPDSAVLIYPGYGGTVAEWRPICADLAASRPDRDIAARAFFERWFLPVAVANPDAEDSRTGLFTGYYIPTLHGSWTPTARFSVPVHGVPPVHLAGHSRSAIAGGALTGHGLELLWVDDPVDLFFMQIQGSGRVIMPDGQVVMLGYAGANGHSYTAIGRVLIAGGEATIEEMSLPFLRSWMARNPHRAQGLMDANASYIYFRLLDGPAVGALGRPLTPGRSLAIDKRLWSLGVPYWVDIDDVPQADGSRRTERFSRLMIAQDTGGAIRGPVRGDVFWGYGEAAGVRAGLMRAQGRYWALIPRATVERGGSGVDPSVVASAAL